MMQMEGKTRMRNPDLPDDSECVWSEELRGDYASPLAMALA